MRRYVHNILASLLCVCLLVSYTPLPASADEGDRGTANESATGAPEPSVGEPADVDAVSGTATTEVKVLSYESLKLSVTQDFAAGIDEIRGNANYDLKATAQGDEPFAYQWYRAVADEDGQPDERAAIDGATEAVYPLSQHADTLTANTTYVYTVQVTDGEGAQKEASVRVTVSDGYVQTVLPDETALPRVQGLSIHSAASLSAAQLDVGSAAYDYLQQAAGGLKLDAVVWQLELTGAPADKAPFVGELSVTLPVNLDELPDEAGEVQVVGLSGGKTSAYAAQLDRDAATATFKVSSLGAFAAAYPVPAADTFDIEASAGEGGSIAPASTTTYAKGARAVYTVLPDEGYRVASVQVDGAPVELTGNTYTFDSVEGDHVIAVTFERVMPDPQVVYEVGARVQGGHGQVRIDGGELAASASAQVREGDAATVTFAPEEGYAIDAVTVQVGDAEPVAMNVFGDAFLLSAVTADTQVVVTYKAGVAPPVLTHEVTATAGEGGTVSPTTQTVPHGRTATVSVRADEGFVLESVLMNGAEASSRLVDGTLVLQNVVEDLRVEASFAAVPVVHTVTASAGEGGSISPEGERSVQAGEAAVFYLYPDKGFELDALVLVGSDGAEQDVTDQVRGGVFRLASVQEDLAVTASFRPLTVTPPDDVYYSVTASAGTGGSVSPAGVTRVQAGGSATFYFVPDEGYVLESVQVNEQAVAVTGFSYTLSGISGDATVAASFRPIDPDEPDVPETPAVHTISASAGAGGAIAPAGDVSVVEGGSMPFAFLPDAGHELASVTVDGTVYEAGDPAIAGNAYRFDDVIGPHAIAAAFKALPPDPPEPDYATVHAEAGEHGSISPEGDVRVELGTDVRFALLPADGYVVEAVYVGDEPVDASAYADGTFTLADVQEDATVRVTFKPGDTPEVVYHAVESSATTGGSISPAGTTKVRDGGSASFRIEAQPGYRLTSLLVDGKTVAFEGVTFTLEDVRADHALRAVFEREQADPQPPAFVTVHARAGEGGAVSPAGDVRVPYNAAQMFTLLPDEGWQVDAVTVDGEPVAAVGSTVTLFNLKTDAELEVSFKRAESPQPVLATYDITAKAGPGGTISPSGTTTVAEGGSVLYALVPHEGYHVSALTVDGVAYPDYDRVSYRFENVAEDHAIEVAFEKDAADEPVQEYVQVTASAGPGGAVSPAGESMLPKGGSQTFYFFPDEGKKTAKLIVDEREFSFSGSSYTLFGVSAASSIRVEFADVEPDEPAPPVPVAHTVSVSAGAGGSAHPAGASKVIHGGSLLIAFVPDEGCEVDEVKVDGETVQHGGASYRLVDVADDATVDVSFKKKAEPEPDRPLVTVDVKVEAHAEGGVGGSVSPSGTISMAHGSSQTFHVFPEEGYDLEQVKVNGEPVQAEPLQAAQPRVQFRAARMATGAHGGYRFTVENVTDDTTISVSFKELDADDPVPDPVTAHEVTASAASGGMISPSGPAWVADGGSITYALKADAGWELSTLTVNGADRTDAVANGSFELAEVREATEVRATFAPRAVDPEPSPYVTVHASASGGGAVSPAGDVRVKAGECQSFAFVPDEGCVLDEVTVDGRPVTPIDGTYTLFDLAADVELRATFRAKEPEDPDPVIPELRTVTATAEGGGTVSPSGATRVAVGGSLLLTFLPDEGCELRSVLLNGDEVVDQVADGSLRLSDVTADCTVRAVFGAATVDPPEPESFTVTATAGDHGAISPEGAVSVEAGASLRFELEPDDGYEVDQVTVDGRSVQVSGRSYTLFDIRSDATVHATFKAQGQPPLKTHTVTAAASAGGAIDPSGTFQVADGEEVSFTVKADEGYVLRALEVDGEDRAGEVRNGVFSIASVEGDVAVFARFSLQEEPAPHDETFVVSASVKGGHGTVSPSGEVRVAKGSSRAFYFYPDAGFKVASVEVDGAEREWTSESYVLRDVQQNHAIAVTFEPIAPFGTGAHPSNPLDAIGKAVMTRTGDVPRAWGAGLVACAAGAVALAAASRRRRVNSGGTTGRIGRR